MCAFRLEQAYRFVNVLHTFVLALANNVSDAVAHAFVSDCVIERHVAMCKDLCTCTLLAVRVSAGSDVYKYLTARVCSPVLGSLNPCICRLDAKVLPVSITCVSSGR